MTLRTKLVCALMFSALLPMLIAVGAALLLAEKRAELQAAGRLETARRQASLLVERRRNEASERLEQAVADLVRDRAAFDSLLGASRPAAQDVARMLAQRHGLDPLEVLDDEGRVLSTSRADAGAGLKSPLLDIPEKEVVLRTLPDISPLDRLHGQDIQSPSRTPARAGNGGGPPSGDTSNTAGTGVPGAAHSEAETPSAGQPLQAEGAGSSRAGTAEGAGSFQAGTPQPSRTVGAAALSASRAEAAPPEATVRIAFLARRAAARGSETLVLVGGRPVDREFVAEIAGICGEPAALVDPEGVVLEGVHEDSAPAQARDTSPQGTTAAAAAGHSAGGAGGAGGDILGAGLPTGGVLPAPGPERADGGMPAGPAPGVALPPGSRAAGSAPPTGRIEGQVLLGQSGFRIVLSVPAADVRQARRELLGIFAGLAPIALVSALAIGVLLAQGISGPIRALAQRAEQISATRREPFALPAPRDEVGRLTASFDRMLATLAENARQRIAAERIAAWQEVARRIAHEVKNPLSPIKLAVENLRRTRAKAPADFDRALEEESATILEEVESLRRLVDEFSQFARLPQPQPVACDPKQVVTQALALFGARVEATGVRVSLQVAPDAPRSVMADPEQLGRLLKNVLANALDALEPVQDRRLTITVRGAGGLRDLASTGGAGGGAGSSPGGDGTFEIEVRDSGVGFAPADLKRVFEPYFTTRAERGGTGLGLAIAYRIVTDHGGTIQASGARGRGATITIRLPLEGPPPLVET